MEKIYPCVSFYIDTLSGIYQEWIPDRFRIGHYEH